MKNVGKSHIYKVHYLAPDGYDHECGCPYCDNTFFQIKKNLLMIIMLIKRKVDYPHQK